jgi:hypothetical protein
MGVRGCAGSSDGAYIGSWHGSVAFTGSNFIAAIIPLDLPEVGST